MSETKYGVNVGGKVRVFVKEKEIKGKNKKTYTVTDVWFNVSELEEDGKTYFNKSMNLIFKRGEELPLNNTVIEFKGFPIITGSGQYRRIAIFVQEWGHKL